MERWARRAWQAGRVKGRARSSGDLLELGAEVGLDDLGAADDVGGSALGDEGAAIEDDDALGDLHDDLHDVLDAGDGGHAPLGEALEESGGGEGLARGQAGDDLVEEDEPGAGGERARDLEALEG